jgi:hypothetical protein
MMNKTTEVLRVTAAGEFIWNDNADEMIESGDYSATPAMQHILRRLRKLEALEQPSQEPVMIEDCNAARQILEYKNKQPAQEPVAWMTEWENQDGEIKYAVYEEKIGKFDIPLYTNPHQWQGLTDDEIEEIIGEPIESMYSGHYNGYRAIEAKLKEKNTV